MGSIGSPETSVHNYHSTLRNIPEERTSQAYKQLRTVDICQSVSEKRYSSALTSAQLEVVVKLLDVLRRILEDTSSSVLISRGCPRYLEVKAGFLP
jgi:hypothetical protein